MAIAFALSLAHLMRKGAKPIALAWQRLVARVGPGSYPALWRVMCGAFPLSVVALGIGAWLALAISPEMAETVAPRPLADLKEIGGGLTLLGLTGCALRGLYMIAVMTPAPPPVTTGTKRSSRRKQGSGKRTTNRSSSKPVKPSGKRQSPQSRPVQPNKAGPAKARRTSRTQKKTRA